MTNEQNPYHIPSSDDESREGFTQSSAAGEPDPTAPQLSDVPPVVSVPPVSQTQPTQVYQTHKSPGAYAQQTQAQQAQAEQIPPSQPANQQVPYQSGYQTGYAQQDAQQGYAQPGHTQPQYAQSAPQSNPQPTPQSIPQAAAHHAEHASTMSRGQVILFGFIGAALACLLAFGISFFVPGKGSSTILGGDSGSTFTVQGGDVTLAEAVAQKTLPSVVNIDVYSAQSTNPFAQSTTSTATSLGSGIILSKDGYILTNYHVVEDGQRFVVVANATEYEGHIVGTDPSSDLAVLKVDATDLTPIEIGNSSDLVVGEWVMAVGSPFGLEQSVSTGIISAVSRSTAMASTNSTTVYTNMIQTDAAINPGNSGGALVDADGKLIGVNTLIASESGSSSGVGFAIPVDYAMDIAQQIIEGKTPSHAQLGITMVTLSDQIAQRYNLSTSSGVYINSVVDGSGAAEAGLQSGDIITKIDGQAVTDSSEVMIDVRSHKIGDKIQVTYVRDGKEQNAEVTLGSDAQ